MYLYEKIFVENGKLIEKCKTFALARNTPMNDCMDYINIFRIPI